jgi:hypothetical protein
LVGRDIRQVRVHDLTPLFHERPLARSFGVINASRDKGAQYSRRYPSGRASHDFIQTGPHTISFWFILVRIRQRSGGKSGCLKVKIRRIAPRPRKFPSTRRTAVYGLVMAVVTVDGGATMKTCAVPLCTCQIPEGKEFCSDECRNGLPSGLCHCPHAECRGHSKATPAERDR